MKNENFLDRLVSRNENWILYNKVQKKHSWVERAQLSLPMAKAGLHQKKEFHSYLRDGRML
jgi:hypothetical protein